MIQCSCTFRQFQMARLIFLVLSVVVVAYGYSDVKECGCNEAMSLCGHMCEPSCNDRHPPAFSCPRIQCTKITENCRCREGYLRNEETKECVQPDECPAPTTTTPKITTTQKTTVTPRPTTTTPRMTSTPKMTSTPRMTSTPKMTSTPYQCGANEQMGNCGRICELKCSDQNTNKCAFTTCAGLGCQCKKGYVRNEETDKCVLASQCPKKCREGEISAACARQCEGSCEKPWRPEICDRIRCAYQDCRCDLESGWVRNKMTDKCVKINQCKNTEPVCPAYSEMKQCGPACERTCRNPVKRLCKLDASKCKPGCSCSEGFVRDEMTGNCVREIACPPRHHSHPMMTVEPVPSTTAPAAGYF